MSLPIGTELETQKLKLELRLKQLERVETCHDEFIPFVKSMWPEFIAGRHHYIIAEKLEQIARGEIKRLIINMPPRHTKSEFASYLFPAWMIGRNTAMKIIQATHTTELAVNFGRKVKNLLETEEYQEIFEDCELSVDSKASGRWDTKSGGMYYAVGVGSNLAGRGGDLIIIDDPHSEQTAVGMVHSGSQTAFTAGGIYRFGTNPVVREGYDGKSDPANDQGPDGRPVGGGRITRDITVWGANLA